MDAPVKTYIDSILCQVNLLFGKHKLPAYKPVLNKEVNDRHFDQASYYMNALIPSPSIILQILPRP